MKKLVHDYRKLSFEERTLFNARFSIVFNAILALAKFILAIFNGIFFVITGIVNIFILISKLECYLGVKYPHKKTFKFRNNMIGIFLILAGIQYTIYMARLIFTNVDVMSYGQMLGICIALISFIEMGVAIKGCFNAYGKGHYYRNIKLINLCSAFTAIVLTEIAIMSFASEESSRLIDGIFGVSVGAIIIFIGVFVLIAPKISIVDNEHNTYKLKEGYASKFDTDTIELKLTNSRFYGDFYYVAKINKDDVDGHIIKGKSPIFKWNIYVKIIVIILSEILIFPYAIGAFVFYFKNAKLVKKLDSIMLENNYIKKED